jgi:hypothetical protein
MIGVKLISGSLKTQIQFLAVPRIPFVPFVWFVVI